MILRDAIDGYIDWQRSHGARFEGGARLVHQFARNFPEGTCCDAESGSDVRRFLAGNGPLTRSRANRYSALNGFYRYAISRGHASRSPLPAAENEPRWPTSAPPHVFTRE